MSTARYWESYAPGEGRRRPRAEARTDARTLTLNGTWRFRLCPTAEGTGAGFLAEDFDDSGWDEIRVPSHWVLQDVTPLAGGEPRSLRGTAEGPLYTNTAFPIPIDPPRVPTENPTGDYRLVFDAPADWGASILRLRGADSCAKVWLNGVEIGWSTGSRLPVEYDAPVRPGRNVLCVRVHRWSAGTYLEDQDMWWLPGIFRDVDVIERPAAAIEDHFVHADYDHTTGIGTLRVDAEVTDGSPARVQVPELGIDVPAGETVTAAVTPWSADRPRLYRGTLATAEETIELAIGFRRVEIADGVLLANGAPLRFHGVNRHEHDPATGRTQDRATMIRDIEIMKRANIDAVRTSHYPPHPDFLSLCDEYGLWVVEECDLETHGFIYAGWENNPPDDPAWFGALQDRIERMVEPDKNHPSVVIWSMANESWTGAGFDLLEQWIRERDPSRPVLYERDPSYRNSDFYSCMYPELDALEAIGRREEPRPDNVTDAEDARRRTLPFLLVEYAHAMGNGPGSLQDYQHILESSDRFCGGFVWEWIDHGFDARTADGTPFTLHGGAVDFRPTGGRFCLDGLVFADRTPSPGLTQLAKAYEPVRIAIGDAITVSNRRHATDTADLQWRWELLVDGRQIAEGGLEVPAVPAGGTVEVALPGAMPELPGDGEPHLSVEARLAYNTAWAVAGHVVSWGQHQLRSGGSRVQTAPAGTGSGAGNTVAPEAARTTGARGEGDIRAHGTPSGIVLGPATFEGETGRLVRLGDLELEGPWLDVHRAPTENDRGQGGRNDLSAAWSAVGIDRMLHRTLDVQADGDRVRVNGRVAAATHPHALEYQLDWSLHAGLLWLDAQVDFAGPWDSTPLKGLEIVIPRLGLLFRLPGGYGRAAWFGRGPGDSYADSFAGTRVGRWQAAIDDLQVHYPVPQENGNHVHTRELTVSGPGVPDLRAVGDPLFDFTTRRWTSKDLQQARFPHELRDSGHVWLNLDYGQLGLGSASVGPALPERYRVARTATSFRMGLGVDSA
ncbi:glycoside hydrolase family 2 TIM barrel-domain containing protein [Ruania rhizosphaerae]|uniref:glycoside hydrolase family 2 TIM barrel-domain containing protein n=1 Tax=Ruania rhizosphaerae TaxID=1840413 RepID=UPI001356F25B|nr:glycoside hydrolase family 2 TIM barrel-domain containing protein [Ruania rhizosphaerae]